MTLSACHPPGGTSSRLAHASPPAPARDQGSQCPSPSRRVQCAWPGTCPCRRPRSGWLHRRPRRRGDCRVVQQAEGGSEALLLAKTVIGAVHLVVVQAVQRRPRDEADDSQEPVKAAAGGALSGEGADALDGRSRDPHCQLELAILLCAKLPHTKGKVIAAAQQLVTTVLNHLVHNVQMALKDLDRREIVIHVESPHGVVEGAGGDEARPPQDVPPEAGVHLPRILRDLVTCLLFLLGLGPLARTTATDKLQPLLVSI
eukprot:CAMPEP_0168385542 /NCGR_PEP_ID=MMETSP0228-20121227/14974_1 /TAXON_ID=133427 /ORGANISM="Protoceratium reticulatum, Strain CCCM 535 (=CCMP 1889)" /LENGTH=257 /DNA_ID=CAMNT_0008398731 /DNA_START=625 /DNA_END=1399 /DNA_ORIENTATION=-